MKNFIKLFGIISLVAVIGFSMIACGGGGGNGGGGGIPSSLIGTWDGIPNNVNQKLKFTSTQIFVCNATDEPTYLMENTTISGDTITHQIGSHFIGDAKWSVSGNTLTISESSITLITNGNYTKVE